MPSSRWAKVACAAVLMAAVAASAALPPASPGSVGAWNTRERGCYCHSAQPSEAVGFNVSGLPGYYIAGATYTIEIAVTYTDVAAAANRSQGGFFMEATAGAFSVPPGMEGLVQAEALQATHTANGSLLRRWSVSWHAPNESGLVVSFFVFVNTVNGNKSETFGTDHWTFKTIRIGVGDQPEVRGPSPAEPPLALETYGLLAVAAAFAAYALYTFYSARRPATKKGEEPRASSGGRRPRI